MKVRKPDNLGALLRPKLAVADSCASDRFLHLGRTHGLAHSKSRVGDIKQPVRKFKFHGRLDEDRPNHRLPHKYSINAPIRQASGASTLTFVKAANALFLRCFSDMNTRPLIPVSNARQGTRQQPVPAPFVNAP